MTTYGSDPVGRQVAGLHPDVTRFNFWRPHATPVPASLLRLTGWLDDESDQEVPVVTSDGPFVFREAEGRTVRAVLARRPDNSANVLFRLEKPGTRERADWEWYFVLVYRIRDYHRKVRGIIAEVDTNITRIDAQIQAEWTSLADKMAAERADLVGEIEGIRGVSVPAGAFGQPGGDPVVLRPAAAATDVQKRLAEVAIQGRALGRGWSEAAAALERRVAQLEDERRPFELKRKWLQPKLGRWVLAGAFPVINAFLSVQALTAATVAMEEFRKEPRHGTALEEEALERLATD